MFIAHLLLVLMVSCCYGKHKFHHGMTKDELVHYFGTPHLHKVPEYDLVSPIRKVEKRSRRHTLRYHVTALGQDYDLVLQRNPDLLPTSCLIHHHRNGTNVVEPCTMDNDDCYYFGTSRSHRQSRVAVSTCLGLNGVIITADHELYIQPIQDKHQSRVRRSVGQSHLVYRKNVTRTSRSKASASDEVFYEVEPHSSAHRRKRSLKKTVELMVVADSEMLRFHGDDTKRYVMTAVNIAAQRLLDASLQEQIHVAVVKLVILSPDQTDLDVTRDAQYTLNKFCKWQEKANPDGDGQPQHADASALITRLDIQNLGNDDATGLAFVHGMCRQQQRCSYNQDTGLDLGLTIAHELGHTMGMTHDGFGNSCENGKYIMSSDGGSGTQGLEWSECSVQALKDFLKTEQSQCLTDEPMIREVKSVRQKPGLIYDADEQCRQSYGEGSSVCEGSSLSIGNDECARLVCFDPALPGKCTGSTAPRMDGTDCGKGKWCIKGKCVSFGENGPQPMDGGWSAWDPTWSKCSRTCGGGVKVKRRHCNDPKPAFGGKPCSGLDVQAKLCNIHKCKTSQESFKAEQCAATNDVPLWGAKYSWVPYSRATGDASCVMDCKAEGESIMQRRGKQFIDGSECNGEGAALFHRCVSAKCRTFGCDGVLDSRKKFDKCGRCDGHSDTCRKVSGTFKKGEKHKFTTFSNIPSGATGILITNKNKQTVLSINVGGKQLFNADGKHGEKGWIKSGDISAYYTPTGPESVKIDGPLANDIEAQVWRNYNDNEYYNVAPDVYFEYHVPLSEDEPTEFSWATKPVQCSKTCGGGLQQLSVSCVRQGDAMPVDNSYCDIRLLPNEYGAPCNQQACPPSWQAGPFGNCSKPCGGGLMQRQVQCKRLQSGGSVQVDDGQCSGKEKPLTQFTCNRKSCPGVWWTGTFSACSLTCGRGQKSRDVQCHRDETSHEKLEESECISTEKPAAVEECLLKTCKSTRSGSGCKDTKPCSGYDVSACSEFREFMELNCQAYCGFCTQLNASSTVSEQTDGASCGDKTDCSAYADDVCSKFKEWSEQNCAKTCQFCPEQTDTTCDDLVDCAAYGDNVCKEYADWSAKQCRKFCGLCSSSADTSSQETTDSTCEDKDSDCATGYADNLCTEYADWARIHCKKHCEFCTPALSAEACVDKVKCEEYGKGACTSYEEWAGINCRKYCGLCIPERRKRSMAEFPVPPPVNKYLATRNSAAEESPENLPARLARPPTNEKKPLPLVTSHPVGVPTPAQIGTYGRNEIPKLLNVRPERNTSSIRRAKTTGYEPRRNTPEPTDFQKGSFSGAVPELSRCGSLVTASAVRINTLGAAPVGEECTFAISLPLGDAVVLHFDKITIDCKKGDDLSVEDGVTGTAIHLCHSTFNYTYTTKGNNALLKLKVGQPGSGYTLTYSTKKRPQTISACSQQFNSDWGPIISHGFPLSNPSGQKCEIFINVLPSRRIELHFQHFDVGRPGNCTTNAVQITDIDSNQTEAFCGSKPGLRWESTGSRVKISYSLDGSVNAKGFSGSYTAT